MSSDPVLRKSTWFLCSPLSRHFEMLGRWGAASKWTLLGCTKTRGFVLVPVKALPCGSLVRTGNSDLGWGSFRAPDHRRFNHAAKPFSATAAPGRGSSRKVSSEAATSRQPVCLVIGAGEGAGQVSISTACENPSQACRRKCHVSG